MDIIRELRQRVEALAAGLDDATATAGGGMEELAIRVVALDDAHLLTVLTETAAMGRLIERRRALATGAVARRSSREAGQNGFAQTQGHRNAVALVQELQGASRTDAVKQVRVAEALLDGVLGTAESSPAPAGEPGAAGVGLGEEGLDDGADGDRRTTEPGGSGDVEAPDSGASVGESAGSAEAAEAGGDAGAGEPADGANAGEAAGGANAAVRVRALPWHEPVDRGLLEGRLSASQADVIRRGLGEPPRGRPARCAAPVDGSSPDSAADGAADRGSARDGGQPRSGLESAGIGQPRGEAAAAQDAEWVELWRTAADQLVGEAPHRTVEDLATAARYLRDLLDPEGAEERYLRRHQARAFRMWIDADGITHGRFTFDDDGAAWMRSVIDAALRPRKGGPRFVDSDEVERARLLRDDPRTNEQLTYDLVLDTMKAGTTATVEQVFGTKLAGVRVVRVADTSAASDGGASGSTGGGYLEDGGAPVPAAAIDQAICQSGTVSVVVDGEGNSLDVGRDRRLFTPRQRIALALRDGGCLWPGCDRVASYSEAHHIDPWQEGGRTDIDRGILVCRFHHMNLHHHGWRIRREDRDAFMLHPPGGGEPIVLRSRSPLRWAREHAAPVAVSSSTRGGVLSSGGHAPPPPRTRTTSRQLGRAMTTP